MEPNGPNGQSRGFQSNAAAVTSQHNAAPTKSSYIPPDTRQARPHNSFDSTPFDASHPSNHNSLPVQHSTLQQTTHSTTIPNPAVQASNIVTNHPRPNLVTSRFEQQTSVSHQAPKPFARASNHGSNYGATNSESNTQSPNRRDVNVLNMNHHFQQSHQPTSQSHQPASSFYSHEANLLPVSTQSHTSQNELQTNPVQHSNPGIISDVLAENPPIQEEKQNDVSQSQWTSVKSDIGISTGSGLQRQEGKSLSTPFGVNAALTGNQEYHSRFDQIKKDNKTAPWQKLDPNESKPKQDVNMISKQDMSGQIPQLTEERRANEPQQNIQRQRQVPQTRQDAFSWGSSPNSMQMRPQSARDKANPINKQRPAKHQTQMGKLMKPASDIPGGKPRQSQGSWGQSMGQSSNAWGDRPPRIPHARQNSNSNRVSSGWNSSASSGQKEEKTNGNVMSKNQQHGMRQGQVGRKPQQSRKQPLTKSDPTLSTSHSKRGSKGTKNSSISNQNQKVSDANPFGVKISPDFEEWCTKEIKSLNEKVDARTLIHFLMSLEGAEEIKSYISVYLGNAKQTNEFADNFVLHKRFEVNDSMQPSGKRRRGKKRGKRKGAS